MNAFPLAELMERRHASHEPYLVFLREDSMSAGLYVLPAGGTDLQSPHTEDEVYVVLGGRSRPTYLGDCAEADTQALAHVRGATIGDGRMTGRTDCLGGTGVLSVA